MTKLLNQLVSILTKIPLRIIRLPGLILKSITHFPSLVSNLKDMLLDGVSFWVLFVIFFVNLFIANTYRSKYCPRFIAKFLLILSTKMSSFARLVDRGRDDGIRHLELFELSYRNMLFKKARTFVTVGGMALGVATIVFLVSLGYGLQKMVVGRVARLDEMRQTDVSSQPGSQVKITDEALRAMSEITGVDKALPLIGVVAKINYNGSISDVAVYGVTSDYLENSAIHPREGKLFESRELGKLQRWDDFIKGYNEQLAKAELSKNVAGVTTIAPGTNLMNTKIRDVKFSIYPQIWVKLHESPSLGSKVIGYSKRSGGIEYGAEYWGDKYLAESQPDNQAVADKTYGRWIYAKMFVYEEVRCEKAEGNCTGGSYVQKLDDKGLPLQTYAFFDESLVQVQGKDMTKAAVLADSTPGALESSSSSSSEVSSALAASLGGTGLAQDDLDFIGLTLESTPSNSAANVKKVALSADAHREAVVNEAFIEVLGLTHESPIDKKFNVSFIVTSDLLGDDSAKVESVEAEYKIVGVIPGTATPFFYVPVSDLKKLGVTSYSQIKLITENKDLLSGIREKVRAMGYSSESVADTVEQINKLFNSIRFVLAIIGGVALGVASLGMFNTLTVSLLERTREVGLMKAMGMTSDEVKKLFLVESMLMGFIGGVLGIFIGFLAGKLFSALLSIFSISKGVGFLDISYVPLNFILLVFGLSLIVGTVTGIYPARRARKISALDAIRYE
jgi:ABC-type antimicrobial peptide transport system permease subunit